MKQTSKSKALWNPACWLFLIVELAHLILMFSGKKYLEQTDFVFPWTAGRMWLQGENPYSPAFHHHLIETITTYAPAKLTEFQGTLYWLYPPQWFALCSFLGLFSFHHSLFLWRLINLTFFCGTTMWLCHVTFRKLGRPLWLNAPLVTFVGLTAYGTMHCFFSGQTSIVTYCGFSLLIGGILTARPQLATSAFLLLLLKPQYGLPVLAVSLTSNRYRTQALTALFLSVLLATPPFIEQGFLPTITGFLHGNTHHDSLPGNTPDSMTGLPNLAYHLAGLHLKNILWLGITSLALLLTTWLYRGRTNTMEQGRALYIIVASCLFLLPLHPYDYVTATALLPLAGALRKDERTLLMTGFLVGWGAKYLRTLLAHMTGHPIVSALNGTWTTFAGCTIVALSTMLLFCPALLILWRKSRENSETSTIA